MSYKIGRKLLAASDETKVVSRQKAQGFGSVEEHLASSEQTMLYFCTNSTNGQSRTPPNPRIVLNAVTMLAHTSKNVNHHHLDYSHAWSWNFAYVCAYNY